jgi:tRNA-binding protein
MSIDWDDFEKLDIRVGTILSVHDFERAKKPAFQLEIDFGKKLELKNRPK